MGQETQAGKEKPQSLIFKDDSLQENVGRVLKYPQRVLYTTVPGIKFSMFGLANSVIQA